MILRLLAALGLLLLPAALPADEATEARIARIESAIQPNLRITTEETPTWTVAERMAEMGIPGVSVAFATDGEVEWVRSWGKADIADDRALTPQTLMLAGSISKPVAALRVHQLAEDGTVDLDANVNDYLTSWQVPDNEFTTEEKVTLRRILNHTAGLTVWGFPGYDPGDEIPSVVDVLDGKGNTDAVRVYKTPGESWQYSGGGYTIMQLAVTDHLGTEFPATMRDHVLAPLGMATSTFDNPPSDEVLPMTATGYRATGEEVEGKRPIYPEMAAAGLWTTPGELLLHALELQRIHLSGENGFLRADTVEAMLTPGMNDHGLGPAANDITFGHGGADEGFRASLVAFKEQPHAWVIMVNSDNGAIIREIELAIAAEYGLPGFEPILRTPITMSAADLEKFAGDYDLPPMGRLRFTVGDNALVVSNDAWDVDVILRPQAADEFFSTGSGRVMKFEIEDGIVTGLTSPGMIGTPVRDSDD